jgi:hypothetical protein
MEFGQEDDITVVTIERVAPDEDSTKPGAARVLATA